MADAQQIKALEAQLQDPDISAEVKTYILEKLEAAKNESLGTWAAGGATGLEDAPVVPGELGLQGILGENTPEPDPNDPNAPPGEGIEQKLDPRFDLFPQALAIQPATTHPGGDEAAQSEWVTGDPRSENVRFAYEPPVAVARQQLLENPFLVRAIFPAYPPQLEEITNMQAGDSLHQAVGDYLWLETAKKAAENGQTVVRYSKAPWAQGGEGGTTNALGLKARGAGEPLGRLANAFIMGADNTAALGVGRAVTDQQTVDLSQDPKTDTMGLNEETPQSQADLTAWNNEEHPLAYGAGQGLGLLSQWGAANRLINGIGQGGRALIRPASEFVEKYAPSVARSLPGKGAALAGTAAVDTASGALGAGVAAGLQEGVSEAGEYLRGAEAPPEGYFQRAMDRAAGEGEAALTSPFTPLVSVVGQLAHGQAERMRWSNSDRGLIGHTEADMQYGPMSVVRGPRLKPELQREVTAAVKKDYAPGDVIAEPIAPKIAERAAQRVTEATARAAPELAAFKASPEGREPRPLTNLFQAAYDKLKKYHAPNSATGALEPTGDLYKAPQKVFNKRIAEVSLTPSEDAIAIPVNEAVAFLDGRHLAALRRAQPPAKAPPGGGKQPFAPEGGEPIAARRTIDIEPEQQPPRHLPITKPGPGDWRDPQPIGGSGRVEPMPTLPANPSLENRDLQRDVQMAVRQGATLPQASRAPKFHELADKSSDPALRGPRQAATGTPPPPPRDPETGALIEHPAEAPSAPATTGAARPARAADAGRNANQAPLDPAEAARRRHAARIGTDLRKKGVDTVYVRLNRYDAHAEEGIIEDLERAGKAKTPAAQDWQEMQAAAMRDRDARPLNGQPAGYSAMKQRHAREIGAEKEIAETVAPGGKSFKQAVRHGFPQAGDKEMVDRLRQVAEEAGVGAELDRLRRIERALEVEDRARLLGAAGNQEQRIKNRLGLRLFPVLRGLEGAGGAGAGAELIGNDRDKWRGDTSARGKYERRRQQQLDEIRRKRAEEGLP